MLKFLKKEANKTFTENGEVTKATTNSYCLDLFATIGALRNSTEQEVLKRFLKAFAENPDLAVKIVFYARDIREGLGERETFRRIIKYLANNNPKIVEKNLKYIAEFGRFDDLLSLFDTPCEAIALEYIKDLLDEDLANYNTNKNVSLLAKWLPSVNTSNELACANGKKIAQFLGISQKEYRQILSKLRAKIKIIENNLREKDYTFEYSEQPSMAMLKYRQAFIRNDDERYNNYLDAVRRGASKMNTATLTPFDLVRNVVSRQVLSEQEQNSLNVMWENLPNLSDDSNTLVVIDTSGSMTINFCTPLIVSISLGLYFAERSKGEFANHFIEFSNNAQLIEIKGENFVEKVRCLESFNECANTDIEAVYNLILRTAVNNRLPQDELPKRLIFVTDMEFDACTENASVSNFENAKKKFAKFGYTLPEIVFWNVNSRNTHQPVSQNEQGVALVSGYTPKLFEMVAKGIDNPYAFMMSVLDSERYKNIGV